jgi:hypothetical protein
MEVYLVELLGIRFQNVAGDDLLQQHNFVFWNERDQNQVAQKFQFVLKTLNLSADSNESQRVKTWDAWTCKQGELLYRKLWMNEQTLWDLIQIETISAILTREQVIGIHQRA